MRLYTMGEKGGCYLLIEGSIAITTFATVSNIFIGLKRGFARCYSGIPILNLLNDSLFE